jgi:hypothetical protein
MGLALEVGILADLKENDFEGHNAFALCFANVNTLLAQRGLPAHVEPEDVSPWSADMYGYSGLHYLRRLAAYADSGIELPGPGTQDSSEDARLKAYFNQVIGKREGVIKTLFAKPPKFKREFDHLIVHSDAEGFYLPIDFPDVLFAADDRKVPGGMVGSVPRLLAECRRLSRILGIPPEITKDSDELWEAADSQGEGECLWQQYGVESFTCVALLEACAVSLKTGAAIAFT